MKAGEASDTTRFIPMMYKKLLPAEICIVEIKGQAVKSSATMARIDKISGRGLRFLSELLFPVNALIVLHFRVVILNETIDLRGTLQGSQCENNLNLYDVVFIEDEQTKLKLLAMLNNLARQFIPLHLRAEYYYNYFSESTYDFKHSRINLLF
ncbi:MAG: hypothetical protein WD469_02520 [Paenibacillaceae bacterium]